MCLDPIQSLTLSLSLSLSLSLTLTLTLTLSLGLGISLTVQPTTVYPCAPLYALGYRSSVPVCPP